MFLLPLSVANLLMGVFFSLKTPFYDTPSKNNFVFEKALFLTIFLQISKSDTKNDTKI
jgi:hypothetical protein